MIPVTKPFVPPISEFLALLDGVWKRGWLTNNGPMVKELELKLRRRLNTDHLLFLSNGTIALQIALRALHITKEVITTPFSYVATTSSLVWERCTPVFVDIDAETLNIDPQKIEAAITPNTQAIMATHCFGNPCDIEAIGQIAARHNLKIIYDAAHCFGTLYKGKSVFDYGNVSTTSFHATKVFHTVEGGAVFTNDPVTFERMSLMRNFGHDGSERFSGIGINGKNSEIHAAMGICNLPYVDEMLRKRKQQAQLYDELLLDLEIRKPIVQQGSQHNHAYYPVIFKSEAIALQMKMGLEAKEIFPRRYFYPSLSSLSYVKSFGLTSICDSIASRILCLPLYHALTESEQSSVAEVLLSVQSSVL